MSRSLVLEEGRRSVRAHGRARSSAGGAASANPDCGRTDVRGRDHRSQVTPTTRGHSSRHWVDGLGAGVGPAGSGSYWTWRKGPRKGVAAFASDCADIYAVHFAGDVCSRQDFPLLFCDRSHMRVSLAIACFSKYPEQRRPLTEGGAGRFRAGTGCVQRLGAPTRARDQAHAC